MKTNFKFHLSVALAGLLASGTTFADGTACGGFVPAVPTLAATSEAVESTVQVTYTSSVSESCSGTLVNDIPGDQKPYILTATHCLADVGAGVGGDSVSVTVNWLAYDSGAIETAAAAARAVTTGTATVEAISGDVALVLLPGVAPGGTYFSSTDFTLVPVASAVGFNVFDDHHASTNSQQLLAGTATYQNADLNGNAANYLASSTNGAAAEGASGSGLRRGTTASGGPVIATLTSGPSADPSGSCSVLFTSIAQGWQGYGTPATAFRFWLDPNNTGLTAIPGTASTTPVPPTITLAASATSVTAGQPVTLTWSSTNADTCTASGSDLNNFQGNEPLTGTSTFIPASGYQTYTLTCTNDQGLQSQAQSVYVSVVPAGGITGSSGGSSSGGSSGGGGGALGLGLLIPLLGAAGLRRRVKPAP